MKTETFPRKFAYVAALAVLLIASFVAGTLATSNQPVGAQDASDPADAAAPDGSIMCTISHIAVGENRIHVYCPTLSLVDYFAYPVTSAAESRQANRYLAILNTALALGKQVQVDYDSNSASNPPGCETINCRRITGMLIAP